MRRVRHYSYGGPEVLRLEEAGEPTAGPGELLVRTAAIGVTLPAVRRVRAGDPTALPAPIGGEVAGTVIGGEATRPGRSGDAEGPRRDGEAERPRRNGDAAASIGSRVTGLSFTGSYAEIVTIPAALATPIPDWASDTLAVALIRGGHVALAALTAAALRPGESVLITAAASGVGHLLVQLAKLRGADRVIAATSSPAKADFLRGLGADDVKIYGDPVEVDVVLDAAGGDLIPWVLEAARPGGRLVAFGSGRGEIPVPALMAGGKTVTGLTIARFAADDPGRYQAHTAELWELARTDQLRPAIHAELPLSEAAAAHRIIEERKNLGKVVLRP
ncbi:quinone oxidoreductase family protein [Actinoplanes sp. CA-142083]|uniref:quinone oxidoreductase family protein n=1 Tax=Actinoplanes sp. CA-142083 TaxID=3239903 RepID=UPI003D8CE615